MKQILAVLLLLCGFTFTATAQSYEKLADDTFKYIKAGTFGKPKVAKNTARLAIGQVRVHYKFITSRASAANKNNAADVTVYLDGEMTKGDLQKLTDEFYTILQQKLAAAGVSFADWKAIETTEYFAERQKSQEDKKPQDSDGKNGQAWLSFSAFDGPVLLKWRPYGSPELVGFGQLKKMAKTGKTAGGDFLTFDVVVDFASIMLNAEIKQDKKGWFYGDPYFHSDYSISGGMSVPQSYIFMVDEKNNFDIYQNDLPIAERFSFAGKPYKDESKAALKTQTFYGGERHTFTPLVIPAKRDLYLTAARRVLSIYAEMFAAKMKLLRDGTTPSDNRTVAQEQPKDSGKTIEQVNAQAKQNNAPTPVTTGELTAAAQDAVKTGNFKLATQYYGELIKKTPNEAEAYFARALVFMEKLNDHKAALSDFSKVIEIKPNFNDALAFYNRGTIHLRNKDWKKAISDFDAFIKITPTHVDAYNNRAIAYYNIGKPDEALADFSNIIRVDPRNVMAYKNRAMLYRARGNATQAQADELRAAQIERGQ